MKRSLSQNVGYAVLLLLVAAAAYVVGHRHGDREDGKTSEQEVRGTANSTEDKEALLTCQEAGITPTSMKEGTCRTATSILTIVDEPSSLELPDLRVRVIETEATPAATPQGRARDRMRISVRLEAVNVGGQPYAPESGERGIYVVAGVHRVDPDPAARALRGALRLGTPIAPGETRTGELRFELAGAATRAVERERRAQLGVRVAADRVGVFRLRFGALRGG